MKTIILNQNFPISVATLLTRKTIILILNFSISVVATFLIAIITAAIILNLNFSISVATLCLALVLPGAFAQVIQNYRFWVVIS